MYMYTHTHKAQYLPIYLCCCKNLAVALAATMLSKQRDAD